MIVKANAKINLCLDVIQKRIDGYHDLDMIMVPLTLADEITITSSLNDSLSSNDLQMPIDESNTILKAIQCMRSHYQMKEHFQVYVEKHIPMEAGLAGGSSDAAAVMRAINELTGLKRPLTELIPIAKQVGADVPFCLMNEPSRVQGIGEIITPITMNCDFHILLVKPPLGVSTGKAFSMLDFALCDHPNCELVKTCLENNDFEGLTDCVSNSLEYSAFQLVPEIKQIKQALHAMQFPIVLMSGSGSTVFALTRDKTQLEDAREKMKAKGYETFITKIV